MKPQDLLIEALRGLILLPSQGTAYRLTGLKYLATPLSSRGSLTTGGRYNKKGLFSALYLADTPATAVAEVQMLKITDKQLVGVRGPPKVLVSVDYSLQTVLDLCSPEVQEAIDTNLQELNEDWLLRQKGGLPIPTQNLGEVIYQVGHIEAMRVPSARLPGTSNLVVFPERMQIGSSLRLFDPEGLLQISILGKTNLSE